MSLQRREVLSAGLLMFSGCTALGRSNDTRTRIEGPTRWETYGREPTHRASYERGSIPSKTPSSEQSYELNGSVATSPVASEDVLAVGDERGILVVPFGSQELPRWLEPPGTVAATPCLEGETVYVTSDGRFGGTDAAHVSAVTADGEETWRTELAANVVTMPTVRDRAVYVRTGRGYLALDANSGETRWRTTAANWSTDPDFLAFENFGPAAARDVIIFPDRDGITAVEPANGTVRWRRKLQKVRSCPVIAGETVYIADVRSGVHAFDVATGHRQWEWSGVGCWSPPAVSDRRIYATEMDDVIALDRESGDLVWRTRKHGLHGTVQSGVSVIGDTVLASSSSLGLASVQTESDDAAGDPGTLRWRLGGRGFNTPIVVDNHIAFVEYSGGSPSLRLIE